MIGNAFPYKNSGYSILETGELNEQTFSLEIRAYVVTDRNGEAITEVPSLAEATAFLDEYFTGLE